MVNQPLAEWMFWGPAAHQPDNQKLTIDSHCKSFNRTETTIFWMENLRFPRRCRWWSSSEPEFSRVVSFTLASIFSFLDVLASFQPYTRCGQSWKMRQNPPNYESFHFGQLRQREKKAEVPRWPSKYPLQQPHQPPPFAALPGRQKGFWPSQYQGLTSPGISFRMKKDGVEHGLKPSGFIPHHEAKCKSL